MADRRDERTWVIVELTPQGEKLVEEGNLAKELRKELGVEKDWPIFIPSRIYKKRGKQITIHLMEGYAFIATGLDEVIYFKLEQNKLVEQVMTTSNPKGMRILSTIPDTKISDLRRKLNSEVASDFDPGTKVMVTEGLYQRLDGTVLETEGDHVIVHFELRSLKVHAKIPKVFLETV